MNSSPSNAAHSPGSFPGGRAAPAPGQEHRDPTVESDEFPTVQVELSVAGATELVGRVLARIRDEAARALAEERDAARTLTGAGRGVLDWGSSLQGTVQPDDGEESGAASHPAGSAPGQLDPAKARRHAQILRDLAEIEGLARHVDAARTWAAGRVDEASAREYGAEGLARQHSFRSPSALTAAVAGISERTAQRRIRLAKLTRTDITLQGEATPGAFSAVAAALAAGTLGIDSAEAIVTGLTRVIRRTGASEHTAAAERELVSLATTGTAGLRHTAEDVARLTEHVAELLDPDGAAPDEAERRSKRFLRLTPLVDGMTRLSGLLDPESAAIMSALVTPTERERAQEWAEHQRTEHAEQEDTGAETSGPRSAPGSEAGLDPAPDDRTPAQRTLDRLIDGIRTHLGTRNAGIATGTSTLVNIHVSAEALQNGTGPSWTDGLFAPLSADSALRELCDGKHAVTLFGSDGAVLAQGRAQRLFTPPQKLALAARDGGCVWPGCAAPPVDCDAHHVIPWSEHHHHGPTDVSNGVLLCRFHHRRIHANMHGGRPPADSWSIRMIRELPHLIPPQLLDWNRTPQPLGRRRIRRTTPARAPARSGNAGPP